MNAAVEVDAVGFARYGAPDVLRPLGVVVPPPGPGQVRVRVAATGVNPADTYLRAGRFRLILPVRLPFVPGLDIAGVVEAVGPGAGRLQPGQPVYGALATRSAGGYAELVLVEEELLALAPSTLTLAESAALPLAALTALQGFRDHAQLESGASVLVWGASGAVGTTAVQVAAALGGIVTAVTRSSALDMVSELGAKEVLVRDAPRPTQPGRRFDVVFDASGTLPVSRLRQLASAAGRCVTVNPGRGNRAVQVLTRLLPGAQVHGFVTRPNGADLDLIRGWVEAGQLQPVIEDRLVLDQAEHAHEILQVRAATGKLVLTVSNRLAHLRPAASSPTTVAEIE